MPGNRGGSDTKLREISTSPKGGVVQPRRCHAAVGSHFRESCSSWIRKVIGTCRKGGREDLPFDNEPSRRRILHWCGRRNRNRSEPDRTTRAPAGWIRRDPRLLRADAVPGTTYQSGRISQPL